MSNFSVPARIWTRPVPRDHIPNQVTTLLLALLTRSHPYRLSYPSPFQYIEEGSISPFGQRTPTPPYQISRPVHRLCSYTPDTGILSRSKWWEGRVLLLKREFLLLYLWNRGLLYQKSTLSRFNMVNPMKYLTPLHHCNKVSHCYVGWRFLDLSFTRKP